ncbi:MAG: hypothetical protein KBD56_08120 [Candidatus Eisenbacteria bacterium]|nr:hypothetical protein [Candidatus Eisenbacteria bacterium]
MIIGIRREDKNRWERRTPIVPDDVRKLIRETGLRFHVQPSPIRVFADEEYAAAGAEIREDLSECRLIVGVKEVPVELLIPGKAYLFFAHVIKCQPYNMKMLARLLELGCTLMDYELITDAAGRRLVFFGRYAGLAGMIDTLHALGRRLAVEGIPNPFEEMRSAHEYRDLEEAETAVDRIATRIRTDGLDARIAPLVFGFAGYGHVSQGAQEILGRLPVEEVPPAALASLRDGRSRAGRAIYKTVFKEADMVVPTDATARFDLQDYYRSPEKYRSVFEEYLPHLSVLVNGVFWTERYPRLVTRAAVRALYREGSQPHLRVIGDISCDIEGSVEITLKATESDQPCFVYRPATDDIVEGYAGNGPVVMAVDNLPCELPRESSIFFSQVLRDFVAAFKTTELEGPFEKLPLPDPLKRATIAYQGSLRPPFAYIAEHLGGGKP